MILLQINFFDRPFLYNTVGAYIWFGVFLAVALLLHRPLANALARIGSGLVRRSAGPSYGRLFCDLAVSPLQGLISVAFLYLAVNKLVWPFDRIIIHRLRKEKDGVEHAIDTSIMDVLDHLFLLLAIFYVSLVLARIVDFIFRLQLSRAHDNDDKNRLQVLPLMREMIKILVWVTGFFWVLGSVFHVNIPALIAGIGIGGVAIALAAKESVENLFAAFTILADKPFQTDDTVKLGTLEGKVEKIGFRSTRLRSGDGSIYIIPNKKLVDENLENLTQRDTRRIQLKIAIKYGVSHAVLQKIVDELKKAVVRTTHVLEPVEAALDTFGENSFQLLLSYHLPHVLSDKDLPAIRQEINMKAFEIVTRYTAPGAATVSSVPALPADDQKDEEEQEKGSGS